MILHELKNCAGLNIKTASCATCATWEIAQVAEIFRSKKASGRGFSNIATFATSKPKVLSRGQYLLYYFFYTTQTLVLKWQRWHSRECSATCFFTPKNLCHLSNSASGTGGKKKKRKRAHCRAQVFFFPNCTNLKITASPLFVTTLPRHWIFNSCRIVQVYLGAKRFSSA